MKKQLIDHAKTLLYVSANFVFRLIYLAMSLFPVCKNRVFVNSYGGKGVGDHPKYIVRELLKMEPGMEIVWLSKSEPCDFPVTFAPPHSLRVFYYMATARIWISTVRMPLYARKRKKQFYCYTDHGTIPFKKLEKDCVTPLSERYIMQAKHDSKMIDIFLSNSRFKTRIIQSSYWYKGDILEIGSCRAALYYDAQEVARLRKKFMLDGRKTVLYAPTFRGRTGNPKNAPSDLDYSQLKETLESMTGQSWTVMVRWHPILSKLRVSSIPDDVLDMTTVEDTSEVIAMSDMLITDYSGIMFDAMEADVPVFLFASDINSYMDDRGIYFNLKELPFPLSATNDELSSQLKNFNMEHYRRDMEKFFEKIGFIKNPHSAKDVALCLMERINGS